MPTKYDVTETNGRGDGIAPSHLAFVDSGAAVPKLQHCGGCGRSIHWAGPFPRCLSCRDRDTAAAVAAPAARSAGPGA